MGYKFIEEKDNSTKKDINVKNSFNQLEMGMQPVQETSDIAQTIKELNDDDVTEDRFSNIDMKTRLHSSEISSIIALDSLIALKFLPENTSFIPRSKKRLAVSQDGKGRNEIVEISKGIREETTGASFGQKFQNLFKGGK